MPQAHKSLAFTLCAAKKLNDVGEDGLIVVLRSADV